MFGSGWNSNTSETSWLSLSPTKNEENPLKNDDTRVLTPIIFQTLKGRKFELIQAYMHCLVSCKNEVDQINKEGARVFTTLFIVVVFFQMFKGS